MRIAQVIGKLAFAGVEAVVNNYCRHIDHDRFQFDYYIDEDSEAQPSREMTGLGARYFYVPSSRHMSSRVRVLEKAFRENQYRIVHSHMNSLNCPVLLVAKNSGVPVRISHCHSTGSIREGGRDIAKGILRHTGSLYATHLMACGEEAGRWLFGSKAFDKGLVTILPNAIDVERYAFNQESRQRLRTELGIQDKFVIGHVGRFMKQKNHEFLIRVFSEVRKLRPDAVLMLVGDGELRPSIEKMVQNLGLSGAVLLLGNRSDTADLYSAMDLFVLPSLYEGLPVVGIEAQAAGLPCLFSDHISKESKILESAVFIPMDVGTWISAISELSPEMYCRSVSELSGTKFDISVGVTILYDYYDSLLCR